MSSDDMTLAGDDLFKQRRANSALAFAALSMFCIALAIIFFHALLWLLSGFGIELDLITRFSHFVNLLAAAFALVSGIARYRSLRGSRVLEIAAIVVQSVAVISMSAVVAVEHLQIQFAQFPFFLFEFAAWATLLSCLAASLLAVQGGPRSSRRITWVISILFIAAFTLTWIINSRMAKIYDQTWASLTSPSPDYARDEDVIRFLDHWGKGLDFVAATCCLILAIVLWRAQKPMSQGYGFPVLPSRKT